MTRILTVMMPLLLLLAPGAGLHAGEAVGSSFDFEYVRQVEPMLSPDGQYIAVITELPDKPGAQNLVTLRLSDGVARAITGFSDIDVGSFFWVSDERLVFSTDKASDDNDGVRVYRGSYTVARDGGPGGRKISGQRSRDDESAAVGTAPRLLHRLPMDFKRVLISRTGPSSVLPQVFLLDVESGRSRRVVAAQSHVTRWITDHRGEVRAAVDQGDDVLDGNERLLLRDEPDGEWRQVIAYRAGDLNTLAFHVDNQSLLVLARIDPEGDDDRKGLYLIDPQGERLKLLVSNPDYDVANQSGGAVGLQQTARGHLIYYQYMADRLVSVYFDPRWSSRQDQIDEALSDTVNTIIDWSDDERSLLVRAGGPGNSADYYLFDTAYQELKYLEPPSSWIKASR